MKNKYPSRILFVILWAVQVLLCGCASIISGTTQPVRITTEPMGARFTVYNETGKEVATGNTPKNVVLSRQGGTYRFAFECPNHYPSEVQVPHLLNPFYFGNILFGGLIGLVIVDPLTGAVWAYPSEVNRNLICTTNAFTPEQLKLAEIQANPPAKYQSATNPKSPKP